MFVARAVTGLVMVGLLLAAPAVASAQDATATTVTPSATQVVHGQTVTLTATVTDTATPATVPTGKVQFYVDAVAFGTPVTLANRTATIVTGRLSTGMRSVSAEYQPDPGFLTSGGNANVTVARAATTVAVRVVPGNGVAGQDIDVEAVVTPTTPPLGAPAGAVSMAVDGVPVATYTLDANGAARDRDGLWAGSHTLTFTYHGDANYEGSGGSAAITIAQAGTFIVLTASPNPAAVGQLVTFDAKVDSFAPSLWWPSGMLSGAVDGVPVPGSAELVGRAGEGAGFARSFDTPGTHMATVHFSGDRDFLAADAALAVTVTGSPYGDPLPNAARRPLAARGLTLKATPSRDRRAPYRFTVTGTLQLPANVSRADACDGRVTVDAKLKAKRVARKTATVTSTCTFKTTLVVKRKGTVSLTAAFAGNASVSGVNARAVKVKAG